MNLIEQLGRYEVAVALMESCGDMDTIGGITPKEIEGVLLQYRRENNIFEVGDRVVLAQFHSLDTVHDIKRMKNLTPNIKGSETTYFLENSLGCWSFQIKHATDAEIKAGHRLEIETLNDHDIPPNTTILPSK